MNREKIRSLAYRAILDGAVAESESGMEEVADRLAQQIISLPSAKGVVTVSVPVLEAILKRAIEIGNSEGPQAPQVTEDRGGVVLELPRVAVTLHFDGRWTNTTYGNEGRMHGV